MAIMRTMKQENPFVQIDKRMLEDMSLSWTSKGILGYLFSRPDGWKIRREDLVKKSIGGKTQVETALLEMMAAGYINWYPVYEDGVIKEWMYDIYEHPDFNPEKEKCMAEGNRRITERKSRNKKRNDKRNSAPKKAKSSSNLEADNQLLDNQELDNQELDNHVYNNNEFSNNEFNNNELNNIENLSDTLPASILKRLNQKEMIDRLILHSDNLSISVSKIVKTLEDLHNEYKEHLSDSQISSVFVDTLNATIGKNIKAYVKRSLETKIQNLNELKSNKTANNTHSEIIPEWMDNNSVSLEPTSKEEETIDPAVVAAMLEQLNKDKADARKEAKAE
ncbi:hypothetical protein CHH49_18090 [Terribacillus saccharophilus]|uniref:hypothetical protein n=1 Tax=Terribacillus saccharophilus TaxID=361277 RepID=UPI000BA5C1B0|nr:hypothetical protein [Terribacillus saccharophilus]PAF20057.1 hypothetical protein CHH49_18090 [Terribacillus saccharophilus]